MDVVHVHERQRTEGAADADDAAKYMDGYTTISATDGLTSPNLRQQFGGSEIRVRSTLLGGSGGGRTGFNPLTSYCLRPGCKVETDDGSEGTSLEGNIYIGQYASSAYERVVDFAADYYSALKESDDQFGTTLMCGFYTHNDPEDPKQASHHPNTCEQTLAELASLRQLQNSFLVALNLININTLFDHAVSTN